MIAFYTTITGSLSDRCVSLCFLTGVFRMALAEISIGFNVCSDLSGNHGYADAANGFILT
jgi:hypothetical protein